MKNTKEDKIIDKINNTEQELKQLRYGKRTDTIFLLRYLRNVDRKELSPVPRGKDC